jgi:ferrous iron transport protein B
MTQARHPVSLGNGGSAACAAPTDIVQRATVALAGNPNCGKTTVFNALTGSRHHVGNYPGVTVERRSGNLAVGGLMAEILDLPGTYSLSARSADERIAAEELSRDGIDVIVNVLDASNLERNLYLTTQLIELRRPMVFALNMMDDAERAGKKIDVATLQSLLGGPVVPMVCNRGMGIQALKDAIADAASMRGIREIPIGYGDDIEAELQKLEDKIRLDEQLAESIVPRWLALGLLESEPMALRLAAESHASRAINAQRRESCEFLERHLGEDAATLLAERRYGFAHGLSAEAVETTAGKGRNRTERLDYVLTHRWLGIPILAVILASMYATTFVLGQWPQGWIEAAFEALQGWLGRWLPHGELASLLLDGLIPGVGTVVSFLPVILILMACISFLEDIGYLARAAFIMDRLMHLMGLHGKSFIPLIMGTGCNVPAIQATRTIEAGNDRLITILVSPLITCAARLPIFVILAGAFFSPAHAAMVVVGLYFLSFLLTMLMGKVLWTFFRGETTPFVMELPPYRMPVLKSTLIHMWEKGRSFLTRAGTVILAGSALIWFFSNYPGIASRELAHRHAQAHAEVKALGLGPEEEMARAERLDAEYRAEVLNTSFAASFGKLIQPVLRPILDPDGTRQDAWKDGVALTAGFAAKEIMVSTMAVMYQVTSSDLDAGDHSLKDALRRDSGMTGLTAISFLVFALLYAPCLATRGMIYMETRSAAWSVFAILYGLCLAWGMSWLVMEIGQTVISW